MDVRIGVINAPRELGVEMDDDERENTQARVEAAFSNGVGVLWLTDKRGRQYAVPVEKIAYVELGSADSDRRIGFGG